MFHVHHLHPRPHRHRHQKKTATITTTKTTTTALTTRSVASPTQHTVHFCVSPGTRRLSQMASPHPCDHGMLSPPSAPPVEANFSLQHQFTPSCKVQKLSFEFDATCTVSAFSFVQVHDTLSFVLRTIVVYSYLERCPCFLRTCSCGWASFSCPFALVGGRHVRPNLGRMNSGVFIFYDCQVESRLMTIAHPLTRPVLAFSAKACCALMCFSFLLVSIHFVRGSGREICLLVHVEFCVKTLHVVTVSVCLVLLSC